MMILFRIKMAYLAFKNPLLMVSDAHTFIGRDGVALLKSSCVGKHPSYEIHALLPEQQRAISQFLLVG